jgi:hypothetical protein
VHRDLKPANVMLTRAGAKLLDFGLARASDGRAVVEAQTSLHTEARPLTEQGTIVGTFQYMAPEQLERQAADTRTDIFALGAVLYEMATARRAFEGKARTSLIAAIVSSQPPDISSVHGMSPPALDHVVRKCLEKDPDDRWQSARDVAAELTWIAEGGSRAGLPGIVSTRRRVRERTAWAACAVATLAAVGFAAAWARRAPKPAPVVRFQVPNPEGVTDVGPPVLSPDGRMIAFDAADVSGRRAIWLRPLDALESRLLSGTEGALRPIWSPDSRSIAFMAGGKLRRVAVAGGPAQTIGDAPTGADGAWGPQGVILFDGRPTDPVWAVDAGGGVPKPIVTPDASKGERGAGFPVFLPGGRTRRLLARRRPRALLPHARRPPHGGSHRERSSVHRGYPPAAVPGPLRADRRARPLPAHPGRPALPGARPARQGRHAAGRRRPQLDRGAPVDGRLASSCPRQHY